MNNALSAAIIYTTADGAVYNDAAKDICLQIAAMNPLSITMADISTDRIDALRAEFTEEMKESGKPTDMIAKIVEGKVSKAVQDDVLLEQISIKDQTKKIKDTVPV
jgi:elongation factor Ts